MDEMMRKLHITSAALARYYGVSARTVYGWRHGTCPDHVMRHLGILTSYQTALEVVKGA